MLKPRKNKNFNYQPRFSDSKKDSETKRLEKSSVSRAFQNKRKPKRSTLPILLIILGLVIVVMYYLETKLR